MSKYLEELCENVDSMVFSGDTLCVEENLEKFREYLKRWERGVNEWEEINKISENN